jgi:hypothetical protein
VAAALDNVRKIIIGSPKRDRRLQTGWEGFFPYYAGYPSAFASNLLSSCGLEPGAVVLDPWNGSGTTTYAAAQLGLTPRGLDLNPVMVVVARARLLASSEADALRPLAGTIISHLRTAPKPLEKDALNTWFSPRTAAVIRGLEEEIRRTVVGEFTLTDAGADLGNIAGTAATLYVALFAACRALVAPFKSSNPTWLRKPKAHEKTIDASRSTVVRLFTENVRGMAAALHAKSAELLPSSSPAEWSVEVADTTSVRIEANSIDLVLTSPPYCTRIDYTAATRVELAVLAPLLSTTPDELAAQMIGSTQVPKLPLEADKAWGPTCAKFLRAVRGHPSKASAGYYYSTHLDYFDKMSRSLSALSSGLKPDGLAILVVQDSYYKDVHNDLPKIIGEMGKAAGLRLARTEKFEWTQSMSRINPHTKAYKRPSHATEAVLCFTKPS